MVKGQLNLSTTTAQFCLYFLLKQVAVIVMIVHFLPLFLSAPKMIMAWIMCCTLQLHLIMYKNHADVNELFQRTAYFGVINMHYMLCHAISNPAEHRFVKSPLRYGTFPVHNESFQSILCNQKASADLPRHKKQRCDFSHSTSLTDS